MQFWFIMAAHKLLDEAPALLSIKLSASDIIPGVAREVLNVLSSCARGLPADAAVWDLSLLQIEGCAVRRQTVLSWLDKAYLCTYGEPFAEQDQHQPAEQQKPSQQPEQQPAVADGEGLEGDAAQQQTDAEEGGPQQQQQQQLRPEEAACQYDLGRGPTFTALTQLLLFADAVGSTRPLLQACAADLEQLRLRVLLPEAVPGLGRSLDFAVGSYRYWGLGTLASLSEMHFIPKAAFPTFQAAVTAQVQQQVEALLYAAYKLELVQLAEVVEGYIRYQVTFVSSILRGQLRPIMSERVMAAAAGFKQLQESLLLSRWCTAPCALLGVPKSFTQRKMAIAVHPAQAKPLNFTAVMLEEFATMPKDTMADVTIDLAQSDFSCGNTHCIAQLLVGPAPCSAADANALLGPSPLWRPQMPEPPADDEGEAI